MLQSEGYTRHTWVQTHIPSMEVHCLVPNQRDREEPGTRPLEEIVTLSGTNTMAVNGEHVWVALHIRLTLGHSRQHKRWEPDRLDQVCIEYGSECILAAIAMATGYPSCGGTGSSLVMLTPASRSFPTYYSCGFPTRYATYFIE